MAGKGSPKGVKQGGRKKGTPNKSTAKIKELAQTYSTDALKTLATIMLTSENDTAKIAAAKELLDRGYGKPTQALEHSGPDGGPVVVQRIELVGLE